MTTITVQLKGKLKNLKDAKVSAARYYSASSIEGNLLTLTYILETTDADKALRDVQDAIDLEMLYLLNVELVSIG